MASEQSSTGTELPYTTATALEEDSREFTVTVETTEGTEVDDLTVRASGAHVVIYDEPSMIEGCFHPSDYTEEADCRITEVESVVFNNRVLTVTAKVVMPEDDETGKPETEEDFYEIEVR